MLLTKKQYLYQQEVFNKVANAIKEMQDKSKDTFEREEKTGLTKAIFIGKSSAYEEVYNFMRSAFDDAYKKEPFAIDNLLESKLEFLSLQIKVINQLLSKISVEVYPEETKGLDDQLCMMQSVIKEMEIILRQTEV
jgi:hypothetical protein